MLKEKVIVIILSIILLTGCNLDKREYSNNYTNVAYEQGKATTVVTTNHVTTTNTTTTIAVPTTKKTTKKVITTTKKVETVIETPVQNNVYTGPKTNELIEEAKAYIVKYNDKINEMIELINIERAKEGLNPVVYDYKMTLAATIRSLEMHYTKVFEHARYCPNNEYNKDLCRKWSTIFTDLKISHNGAGENIARGFTTMSGAMNGFMNSPSHRKNIMNPNYKYVGIGVAEDGSSTYYISQEFKA